MQRDMIHSAPSSPYIYRKSIFDCEHTHLRAIMKTFDCIE